ncbi:uncharacterized protein LOC108681083 [Hyalella azteca]|uniref:Uncharacterized protein LOC108681083 n=1 Tax=Hyalella azteca TaxID=294128 RepID=A0A8B7PHB6_HYAAZ|nr:uncharacterized protein LOC108681083 [Hyalella azteca]
MKSRMPRVVESILHDNPLCKGVVEVIEVQFKNGKGTLTRPERPRISPPPPPPPLLSTTSARSPISSKFMKKLRSSKACVDLTHKEDNRSNECSVLADLANKSNISSENIHKSPAKVGPTCDENKEPLAETKNSERVEAVKKSPLKTEPGTPSPSKRATRSCTKACKSEELNKSLRSQETCDSMEINVVDNDEPLDEDVAS